MTETRKKVPLIWKITVGFILGVLAGALLGPKVAVVEPIGKIFITLLQMLIVPLVFSSLVVGVASLGDPKALGRIGVKTVLLYMVTTALAIVIGLAMGHLIQPGAGMAIEGAIAAEGKSAPALKDVVIGMFPSNPIQSLAQGHMLQIIVFALFFGIAAVLAGEKGKPVLAVMDAIAETMYKVTALVMAFAPYGVFALIAVTVSRYGLSVMAPFAKVIGAVYLGCLLHAVVVYSGLVSLMTRKTPVWFFRGIQEASLTAFVTRSSSATLPVTMRCSQDNLGVSEKITSFVLPLGATINMDGTALYQGVCALFIAQAFGIDLSLGAQAGIIVTATLASVGTAGVPGAGLIMLTLVVTQAGLPMEGVALLAGIDAVLDMARTALNITGDACVATVVARTEGELNHGA
ncbi:dicarboxylate/amino acid:cation symporter [Aminithiophilus ramosus]|uniref:Dicarboxylate/amino acid:cation symporter n=2 Tax=Synergistales TaxID=649776 RepID=A0A9Q7EZX4_9BACT|nr:dicarboxylate/amino acid:cation symporter [Aminithiophilus ramosus]QTX32622.1 dicarboxylate/amino acid:cation symporter [Aminithiophilus ramosus]QVL36498.1 dicarboxylate/amino acid:cation symporter [Synergistota bacterium]